MVEQKNKISQSHHRHETIPREKKSEEKNIIHTRKICAEQSTSTNAMTLFMTKNDIYRVVILSNFN